MTLDGARLAICNSRLNGVARKMANTLLRTGRSGVLNRAHDFSCCIITAENELIAAADSLPIHVLSGPDLMGQAMKTFHPHLKPGDAFLHNSPYHGCSHAADHTLLVPVFDDRGQHRFTVLAKAHQADIGNSVPTTYHGAARDVYEEGALIFPAVQVARDGEIIDDIVRMCRMRIRVPEQWWGDFLAMMGAVRIGERELIALGREVGWDLLDSFAKQWFDYSELLMDAAIRKLPGGTGTAESTHDHFPGTPEDGVVIRSKVTVRPEAGSIEVDLRDNPDNVPSGLNLSEACSRTSALIGVFNSIDSAVPKNAGSFRRVHVMLRHGCVVGIPLHPTSCSVATTNIADRVANSVQCAIAEIGEGLGMAEVGAIIPPSNGVVSGIDPRNGRPFVNQVFLGITGGGARPDMDAWITYTHAGNGGMCYLDSIEMAELEHPIQVGVRKLMIDTEGAGQYRGAPSMLVEFGPTAAPIEVGYVSDGTVNPPKGARGGLAGGNARQYLRTRNGATEELPSCAQVIVNPGETIVSITTGGGGYGDPHKRDRESVRADITEKWISPARAQAIYGL